MTKVFYIIEDNENDNYIKADIFYPQNNLKKEKEIIILQWEKKRIKNI